MSLTKNQKELAKLVKKKAKDILFPKEQIILKALYEANKALQLKDIVSDIHDGFIPAMWRLRADGLVVHVVSKLEDRYMLNEEVREHILQLGTP